MNKLNQNEIELQKKLEKIYIQENKLVLNEKDAWYNTALDVIGIFDPTGAADLINGIDRIRKGDYVFGFLSLISAVPYVGDIVAKPLLGISKGSKLYINTEKALKLSKAGNVTEAAKLLDDAAKGNRIMNKLVGKSGEWAERIKSGIDAIPFKKLTAGPRNMIKDWCDLFIQVAKRRKQYQTIAAGRAAKIVTDPKTATQVVTNFKKMMDKGFFKNVKLSRLKGVSFLKPWSAGWMAKYIWPTTTFGLLYRNRDMVSLSRRTRFYWGFIDFLGKTLGITIPEDVTPETLTKYVPEGEIDSKFKDYAMSPDGQKYWDEDMQGVNIKDEPSTSSLGSKSDKKSLPSLVTTKMDPIDIIFDEIFS